MRFDTVSIRIVICCLSLTDGFLAHGQDGQIGSGDELAKQLSGLRYERFRIVPLRFRPVSMEPGKMRIKVYAAPTGPMEPPSEKTVTLTVGSVWPDHDYYVVVRIVPERITDGAITRDANEFTLRDTRTGREFTVPTGESVDIPDTFAVVTDTNRNVQLQFRLEQEIAFPAGSNSRFKVTSITHTQLTLKSLTSGREFHIQMATGREGAPAVQPDPTFERTPAGSNPGPEGSVSPRQ